MRSLSDAVGFASRGEFAQAEAAFAELMQSPMRSPAVDYNYAVFCRDCGRPADAVAVLREMLRVHSTHAPGLRLLAELLVILDPAAFPDVLRKLKRVVTVDTALLRLEAAYLSGRGDHSKALELLGKALEVGGRTAETLFNYSVTLERTGDRGGAVALLEEVLTLAPGHALAAFNLSHHLLASGHFGRGWDLYESRWHCPAHQSPAMFAIDSEWDGSATRLPLVVWPEQGLGEKILFSGFITDVLSRAESVWWITDTRLVPLLAPLFPAVRFVASDSVGDIGLPEEFEHVSAGRLGKLFGRAAGFQRPRLAVTTQTAAELELNGAVGISWRSTSTELGPEKSFPLASLGALIRSYASVARIVCLQHDLRSEEEAWLEDHGVVVLNERLDLRNDLASLVGLVGGLSRVISASNTIAHLSGASGVQTDVFTSAGLRSLWFWENPTLVWGWYPSVRVHRQEAPGDWASAFAAAGLPFGS